MTPNDVVGLVVGIPLVIGLITLLFYIVKKDYQMQKYKVDKKVGITEELKEIKEILKGEK